MFNKSREEPTQPRPTNPSRQPAPRSQEARTGPPATLGPSIAISGNLSGNEDLVIEGSVEGEVVVKDHMVTISQSGRVKADVYGRSICVEGEVDGNLVGDQQVIIRESGRVRGNVTAPRVNLENGAKFKGSIDMQPTEATRSGTDISERESSAKAKESSEAKALGAGRAVQVAGGKA